MGNRLLASLEDLPFPPEITRLMHQLMQDLDRAHNQLTTTRQNLQAEFLSYRELVRHINRALFNAQKLLDELSYSRADARIRLRINVLQRSLQMLQHHSTTITEETSQSRRKRLQHFQMLIDLYVDIAILESRKNYNSTALEGIRVIREAAIH
jgi:chromosome segregation ATPase